MFSVGKIHFEISERKLILRVFDVLFVLVALYVLGQFFEFDYFFISTTNYYWTIVLAVYLNFFGTIFEMYNLQVASNQFQVLKSTLITASVTVLVYLLTPFFSPILPSSRLQILLFYSVAFISLYAWRILYVVFLASNRFYQKAILICDQERVQELIEGLEDIDPHYKIVGYVKVSQLFMDSPRYQYVPEIEASNLLSFVKENNVAEIVVATHHSDGINNSLYQNLLQVLESGTVIREYTQVYESKTQRIPIQYMEKDFYRCFPFSRSNHNKLYLIIVRFCEIVIALLGVFIGLCLIPFLWIGNSLGNKGSLFYFQERVGKNGVVFQILKFRTMIENAEKNGAVFTTINDCRVTAFGKFLRKTRIDEFPQFINIIKGDMSVIGPRPERPVFVKEIGAIMPFYDTRHIIKPGLTGWAQVSYSYGDTIADSLIKLQYDLYYIKHRSIYLDLNIVFKTITTVLFYRGQ
ncbi:MULTISPECIES: exopolysaccharide biosynthesis polyprenyl glycosylphosphotransferase [unclassified Flavobacterium]|uniref:exopolysaccharide biosynthesis polyprenyl glycosylphosphotransferase n=1 Tax=unclassified Flavobacterium TaxID=196869 RepID=UPI00131B6D8E|nr:MULTISPECIES: exopolysaccharide biosynthesis polyprenyl glycosylphosphotransferase [unclassified Flavobacterium]